MSDVKYTHLVRSSQSGSQKWKISIIAGVLFALLSLPYTYGLTDSLAGKINKCYFLKSPGGPNMWGILVHALIMILLIRLAIQFVK